MSWIFGAFGNINEAEKHRLKKIVKKHLKIHGELNTIFQKESKNYLIIADGNKDNILFGLISYTDLHKAKKYSYDIDQSDDYLWVTAGIGIINDNGIYKIMRDNDWNNFFTNEKYKLEDINGHFCSIILSNNEIEIFTDQLGTRDIYFIQKEDYFVFSTKLDLLTKFHQINDLDFRAMGSLWLLESQINTGCFIKNIQRLTCSAKIYATFIKKFEITFQEKAWTPKSYDNVKEGELYKKLQEFVYLPVNENLRITLALSGGMDSRMLLSLLIELFDRKTFFNDYSYSTFDTFSFGVDTDLDVEIPAFISQKLGFNHRNYFGELIFNKNTLEDLTKFIIETKLTFPASEYLLKRNYNLLPTEDSIIIDGCWGEITRRSLFKRLIAFAPNAIERRDSEVFFKYMQFPHADIFNKEITSMMIEGAIEHLEDCLHQMPDIYHYTLESWMDLFAIRTKHPNLVGVEQARIDNLVRSFSPFAQPDFFNLIFGANTNITKKGTLIKKIFKMNQKRLDKYPLNAGGIRIPFSHTSPAISLKKKLFSFFPKNFISYKNLLLNSLNDHLPALINSISFVKFNFLDRNKIIKIYLDYKNGIPKAANELDWALAFLLFIEGINNE